MSRCRGECYIPWYICGGERGVFLEPGPSYPCEGRDEPYVEKEWAALGATYRYRFTRTLLGHPEDAVTFARSTGRVTEDTTITAHYDYRTGRGGLGEGPAPTELPATGGGGIAGGGDPAAAAVGMALPLAAGAYASRERGR